MTYVEFFDKDMLYNVCSSLYCPPDRICFAGGNPEQMNAFAARYCAVMNERFGKRYKKDKNLFLCRLNPRDGVKRIVSRIKKEILDRWDDCVFDVTGGSEVYLIALGMIAAEKKAEGRTVQMQKFRFEKNSIRDIDQQQNELIGKVMAPGLTVEQLIRIYGGRVVYSGERENATHVWNWTEDFKRSVDSMWSVCRRDPELWNRQIAIAKEGMRLSPREVFIATGCTEPDRERRARAERYDAGFWTALRDEGLLEIPAYLHGAVLRFKDEQICRCLTEQGKVLELKICLSAMRAEKESGGRIYENVLCGVYIDWDGILQESARLDTSNEVDAVLMHGLIPVFVSCKNGAVDGDELYKLSTVVRRFGGAEGKKVLAASLVRDKEEETALMIRAKGMGVKVLDANDLSIASAGYDRGDREADEILNAAVAALWR